MRLKRFLILPVLLISAALHTFGQEQVTLNGTVKSETNVALDLVNIALRGGAVGTATNNSGEYTLKVPYASEIVIQVSCIGYSRKEIRIKPSEHENPYSISQNIVLFKNLADIDEVLVKADRDPGSNLQRIDPKMIARLPGASGSFEDLLKVATGVTSNNELSSQYSVRGGNYDENLVYVNDIEIYRPLLIRSGQQEGLSFINPSMVSSVLFSAGGFDARYGDKMASVLDIKYRKPSYFAGSATGSLMGGSMHFEGTDKSRRFSFLTGLRYKSNRYLLNSLETKGDYNPRFTDFQLYLTYGLTAEWEFSFLGNVARNVYTFIPEDRETSFGTVHEAYELRIFFDGQEKDAFSTYLGAFTTRYQPNENFELKWIFSAFHTNEQETFDIQGQYLLNELDRRMDSETFADSLQNIGIGTYLDHARNRLKANVMSVDHKGTWTNKNYRMQWGVKWQQSLIQDFVSEWMMIDSSGYSLPYSDSLVLLSNTHFAASDLQHTQLSAYHRNSYELELKRGTMVLSGGIRGTYLDVNKEFLISPRGSISFLPIWEKDLQFRLSAGAYHQPPFFKEFRNLSGQMNPNVKAQKSVHIVGGTDYFFVAWSRPFKFTTELYYKYLWDLIPYEVNNVRIRYFGDNMAHGYAAGFDLKVNGEFVPGIESWASISILKTQEDIIGDTVGFIARPTDQRVNVAVFFQDYLPFDKSYKAHLNLLIGTGLPYGPPGSQELKTIARIPPYRRVDLGFSKNLINEENPSKNQFFKHVKTLWLSLEFFNLLDINNTVSHIWIRDISNRQFSIPNYLTGFRFNVKLQANF